MINFQIAAKGEQPITIPSCIAPGQYLLRAEMIALHGGKLASTPHISSL